MDSDLLQSKDYKNMIEGKLYSPGAIELVKARRRCANLCQRLNDNPNAGRREQIELWRK